MARLTFPVPPSSPDGTFSRGWNDRCLGKEFRHHETPDWQIGWKAADGYPDTERRPYNDTAALAGKRPIGKAA